MKLSDCKTTEGLDSFLGVDLKYGRNTLFGIKVDWMHKQVKLCKFTGCDARLDFVEHYVRFYEDGKFKDAVAVSLLFDDENEARTEADNVLERLKASRCWSEAGFKEVEELE